MESLNYQEIIEEILNGFDSRQKEIIERRFGLRKKEKETLESIGKDYGLTRERVRQIQNHCFDRAKVQIINFSHTHIFDYFEETLMKWGGLRRENKLIQDLGEEKIANQIVFLFHLAGSFKRKKEDREFYTIWLSSAERLFFARRLINQLEKFLEKEKQLFTLEELFEIAQKKIRPLSQNLNENSFLSFIEATKKIEKSPLGQFGLSYWPEINPRGVKDRVYLALKNAEEPLHFQEITQLINKHFLEGQERLYRKALPQTVHNELIKDSRFVLVGRGLYALKEWGFEQGTVKDVIYKVLKTAKKSLSREEILEEVFKQRLVKTNTILLELNDKRYFQKNSQGRYTLIK